MEHSQYKKMNYAIQFLSFFKKSEPIEKVFNFFDLRPFRKKKNKKLWFYLITVDFSFFQSVITIIKGDDKLIAIQNLSTFYKNMIDLRSFFLFF